MRAQDYVYRIQAGVLDSDPFYYFIYEDGHGEFYILHVLADTGEVFYEPVDEDLVSKVCLRIARAYRDRYHLYIDLSNVTNNDVENARSKAYVSTTRSNSKKHTNGIVIYNSGNFTDLIGELSQYLQRLCKEPYSLVEKYCRYEIRKLKMYVNEDPPIDNRREEL